MCVCVCVHVCVCVCMCVCVCACMYEHVSVYMLCGGRIREMREGTDKEL